MKSVAQREGWAGIADIVVRPIAQRWPLVIGLTVLASLMALVWQAVRKPTFTASAVLVASRDQSGSGGGGLGGLGGIAAAAGVSIGAGATTEFDKFKFLITSYRLAEYQTQRRPVLRMAFFDDWDNDNGGWKRPTGLVQSIKDAWWPTFGLKAWQAPDAEALTGVYARRLVLRENKQSGLVEVSFEAGDPDRASTILRWIITDGNAILKRDAAQRARERASYLRLQIQLAQVAEYRSNLARLLADEEQTLMMVSTSLPYAAETVQDVAVNSQPTSQRPILYMFIAGVIGFSMSCFLALVLPPPRKRRKLGMDQLEPDALSSTPNEH